MRIAFFGGTFDPPHRGHIAVARAAIERLAIDRVLVAPVAVQPLKGGGAYSSFEDRLAMVRLAVEGDPRLVASSVDAPRPDGEPNYTLDTLVAIQATLTSSDTLYCLAGADTLSTLRRWRHATELLLFCNWIVAARPGFSLNQLPAALPEGIEQRAWREEPQFIRVDLAGPAGRKATLYLLPDVAENISATEARTALARGSEVPMVLAPQVAAYIRAHGLYQGSGVRGQGSDFSS